MGKRDNFEMTEDEYHEHCSSDDGICIECGEIQDGGVEPDAEGYECGSCGAMAVMGIENALLDGRITIVDSEGTEVVAESDDAEDIPH